MKRRTRYLFIALGFLIFGVLSPLIVLYVSGFSYDWNTDQLSATGLLSVTTLPSKAEIFLDGKQVGTTPATVRFLKARDYQVTIKKEGYFDWTKTLPITTSQVTWASNDLQELHLIRKDAAPVIVASNAKDFFAGGNFSVYLTDSDLIKTKLGDTQPLISAKLPAACDSLAVSPTENLILVTCGKNSYLYNQSNLKPVSIQIPSSINYVFGPEDSLYSLEKGALMRTDTESGKRVQIAAGVSAYTFQQGALYRLESAGQTQNLVTSPLYSPNQTQTLLSGIPIFKSAQIYVARSKEIFLLGDGTLYRVNDKLEPLQSGVTEVGFNAGSPSLSYTTGFELYSYDFAKSSQSLVLRDAGSLASPQGKADLGYILFTNGNKLQAAEVDTRDHVNNYTLTAFSGLKKYATDDGNSLVYFLDGSNLKYFLLK